MLAKLKTVLCSRCKNVLRIKIEILDLFIFKYYNQSNNDLCISDRQCLKKNSQLVWISFFIRKYFVLNFVK